LTSLFCLYWVKSTSSHSIRKSWHELRRQEAVARSV
jgi:hypothetical protein